MSKSIQVEEYSKKHIPKVCPNMSGRTPTAKGTKLREAIIKLLKSYPGLTRIGVSQHLGISIHRTIWYLDSMAYYNLIDCYKTSGGTLLYYPKEDTTTNYEGVVEDTSTTPLMSWNTTKNNSTNTQPNINETTPKPRIPPSTNNKVKPPATKVVYEQLSFLE